MTESIKTWWSCALRLSRWREYILLVGPLTLVPLLHSHTSVNLWQVGLLLLANFFSFAFAFAINEVEDAEDDAKDADRGISNPINSGEISYIQAFWLSLAIGLMAVVCYSLLGLRPYLMGVMIFLLGLTYSWRFTRLKAKPGVDLLSHALVLGTLQYLVGVVVFGGRTDWAVIVSALILIVSIHGQLHNQLRDYHADRVAGLANTASFIRLSWLRYLQGLLLLSAGVMGLYLVFIGAIPLTVIFVFATLLVVVGVSGLGASTTGSRPGEHLNLLWRSLLNAGFVGNIVVILWMVWQWQNQLILHYSSVLGVSVLVHNLLSLPKLF